MATVQLRFSALPSHVRTARLVAAAVARRAGVDESVLDEVRLAVGEACSRAVGLHRASRPDEPVMVTLSHETGRFTVEVSDSVPAAPDRAESGLLGTINGAGPADTAATGYRGSGTAPGGGPGSGLSLDAMLRSGVDQFDESADLLSGSMGLALITGLVDDLSVHMGADGAVIRMSWPAATDPGAAAAKP